MVFKDLEKALAAALKEAKIFESHYWNNVFLGGKFQRCHYGTELYV